MESWRGKTRYFNAKRNKSNLYFSLNDPDSLPMLIALTRNETFCTSTSHCWRECSHPGWMWRKSTSRENTESFGVYKYMCLHVQALNGVPILLWSCLLDLSNRDHNSEHFPCIRVICLCFYSHERSLDYEFHYFRS